MSDYRRIDVERISEFINSFQHSTDKDYKSPVLTLRMIRDCLEPESTPDTEGTYITSCSYPDGNCHCSEAKSADITTSVSTPIDKWPNTEECACEKQKKLEGKDLSWCPCETDPHEQMIGHCVVCGGQLKTIYVTKPPQPEYRDVPSDDSLHPEKWVDVGAGPLKTSDWQCMNKALRTIAYNKRLSSSELSDIAKETLGL